MVKSYFKASITFLLFLIINCINMQIFFKTIVIHFLFKKKGFILYLDMMYGKSKK